MFYHALTGNGGTAPVTSKLHKTVISGLTANDTAQEISIPFDSDTNFVVVSNNNNTNYGPSVWDNGNIVFRPTNDYLISVDVLNGKLTYMNNHTTELTVYHGKYE